MEAIERHVQPLTKFPVVWGFDPSGTGKDRSVLIKRRDNLMMGNPIIYSTMLPEQLAARVREEFDRTPKHEQPAEICVDGIGVGHGIVAYCAPWVCRSKRSSFPISRAIPSGT